MKKNMGGADRIIRLIVAAVLLIIVFATNLVSGGLSYVLIAVAAIFALTSFISFCPLYLPFKINTGSKDKE